MQNLFNVKYLRSACRHHILDGSFPYSMLYGKGNFQTWKTTKAKICTFKTNKTLSTE